MAAENTGKNRVIGRPFKKGQSGNPAGKPKGSRNKLGEAFLSDMYNDWLENGVAVIQEVRAEKPDVYLRTVASILPRDRNVNINPLEEAGDDELIQRLRDLDSIIRPFLGAERGGGDSEGTGTPRPN
jgi:hypothetical protein